MTLQKSHALVDINKDKFLVMSTLLPENMDVHASHNQITELWKTKNGNSARVENHRLKCCSSIHDTVSNNPADGMKHDSRIYRSEEDAIEMKSPSEGLVCFSMAIKFKITLITVLIFADASNFGK